MTYDLTLAVAGRLARLNPAMTFIYVSGAGTDSTERGHMMWTRVKGATEKALLRLPFKAACMFRPAVIVPLHGIKSKTKLYQAFYTSLGWLLPLLYRAGPKVRHYNRAGWARHDPGRQNRRPQAGAREPGHQQHLSRGAHAKPGIPETSTELCLPEVCTLWPPPTSCLTGQTQES